MIKVTQSQKYSLFIILAAVLWAVDGVLRRSLFSLPPITIVFMEHLIGSMIIIPFFLNSKSVKDRSIFTKRILILSVLVAFFSGLLGTLFFTAALAQVNFISFSVVMLLQKLQPIFAVLAAWIILREKITSKYLGWSTLAMGAAYLMTFPIGFPNLETGSGTVVAALLATGAAFFWGSSTVISKLLLKEVNSTEATSLRFFFTMIFAGIGIAVLNQQPSLAMIGLQEASRLVMIALSTGMVALWLYYTGLKQVEAKISTMLELVFPALAVIVDVYLYKTALLPIQYIAGLVLVFAVYQLSNIQNSPIIKKETYEK